MRARTVVSAALYAALFVSIALGEPAKEPAKDPAASSLEARRAKCMKLEPKALGIVEPIDVKESWHLKDGGSLTLLLVDKNKAEHEFIIRRSSSGPMDITKGPKLKEESKRVETGGSEEQELYGVLLRWADKHPKKADLLSRKGALADETLHGVQGMLIRLDNRITLALGGVVQD